MTARTQLTPVGGSRRYSSFLFKDGIGEHPFVNGTQLVPMGGSRRYGSFASKTGVPGGEHPFVKGTQLTAIGGSRRYADFARGAQVYWNLDSPLSLAVTGTATTAIYVTGELVATDGADLGVFAGLVAQAVTGELIATDGADAGIFIGDMRLDIDGVLGAYDGADAALFAGAVASSSIWADIDPGAASIWTDV